MARPMSASAFLAALRAEGVRLCPDCLKSNWPGNSRGPLGDVVGSVIHHTASNATPTSLIREGRPDLNGPLSIGHMTRPDGVIHLVGYGRCNHAGKLDGDVLAAMRRGEPAPRPNVDTVNANPITYSLEVNGTADGKLWTPDMVDNAVRFEAAICRAHDWNAFHVIGHREGTTRKPTDPAGILMQTFRALVDARLRGRALLLGDRVLGIGDGGADVVQLQRLLRIDADGEFGPATQAAVVAFQRRAGLEDDGLVGPNTLKALLASTEKKKPPVTPPVEPPTPTVQEDDVRYIVTDPRPITPGGPQPQYLTDLVTGKRWVQTPAEYHDLLTAANPPGKPQGIVRIDLDAATLDAIPTIGRKPGEPAQAAAEVADNAG